ncbi:helix-turn-helix domain-containing protein [Spirosoma sp. HMF4905]|uniref:Helix-turn-helix domain-containing protein n=1 Tax=Spirosoma arboris TaxID=2682092 RepID=A0A7K1S669_9BACT|nr:helix-turn-helix transcriptional regulator [Spirosoma arboris]MVM29307.1 helix-turn-helix domain-containing protein [Spirosoma arboris]
MSKVYESIKAIRTAKNLKQEEVAQKLGMAQSNYARMEKGLTQITVDRLEELAEVFEMSVTSILSYEIGQQQPTTEDIAYYIDLYKKNQKTIENQKKRIAELEEESLNDLSRADDELKTAKLKIKDLNERLKDKERTIQVLEKALNALTKS